MFSIKQSKRVRKNYDKEISKLNANENIIEAVTENMTLVEENET